MSWELRHGLANRPIHYRAGKIGRNYQTTNAHVIEDHFNFNGGGPKSFGGAAQWPVISVSIALPEDTSREVIDGLIAKIKNLIDQEVPLAKDKQA